jgi:hypothetical protein
MTEKNVQPQRYTLHVQVVDNESDEVVFVNTTVSNVPDAIGKRLKSLSESIPQTLREKGGE